MKYIVLIYQGDALERQASTADATPPPLDIGHSYTTPVVRRGSVTASLCCSAIRTSHAGTPSRSPLGAPSSTAR